VSASMRSSVHAQSLEVAREFAIVSTRDMSWKQNRNAANSSNHVACCITYLTSAESGANAA
jgi:hypothetical protein